VFLKSQGVPGIHIFLCGGACVMAIWFYVVGILGRRYLSS